MIPLHGITPSLRAGSVNLCVRAELGPNEPFARSWNSALESLATEFPIDSLLKGTAFRSGLVVDHRPGDCRVKRHGRRFA
jgi:hypothetical protein